MSRRFEFVRLIAWGRAALPVLFALALGAGSGHAGGDADELPKLPGNSKENSLPLPTTDQMEAMAKKYEPLGTKWMAYAKSSANELASRGGMPVAFTRLTALIFAALPECAYYFNRASFQYTPLIYLMSPGEAKTHFDRCLTVSIALGRRREQTDEVRVAAAYGRLAHAWGALLTGESVDAAPLKEAAETVQSLASVSGLETGAWKSFVVAAAGADARKNNEPVTEWAAQEAKRLAEGGEEGIVSRVESATSLGRAIGLAAYEVKEAGATLGTVIPPLAVADAIQSNDFSLNNLYNRALTYARGLKVPLKAEYRFDAQSTSSGLLQFKLPRAVGWAAVQATGDQMDGTWTRDRGVLDRTTLRVWKYSTSKDYVESSGKRIGGDNVGARMKQFFDDDKASVAKVKKASPSIGRLSKSIAPLKGYEVRGEDNVGLEMWYREWYFKPAASKEWVLNVSLRRTGILLQDDAEIEFVLDSMTEPPK